MEPRMAAEIARMADRFQKGAVERREGVEG
jgi:hypothetical protein